MVRRRPQRVSTYACLAQLILSEEGGIVHNPARLCQKYNTYVSTLTKYSMYHLYANVTKLNIFHYMSANIAENHPCFLRKLALLILYFLVANSNSMLSFSFLVPSSNFSVALSIGFFLFPTLKSPVTNLWFS